MKGKEFPKTIALNHSNLFIQMKSPEKHQALINHLLITTTVPLIVAPPSLQAPWCWANLPMIPSPPTFYHDAHNGRTTYMMHTTVEL